MPRLFPSHAEPAYERNVLFAVELLDPVTLARISQHVRVSAPPLLAQPIVNYSGRFVWLIEGDLRPEKIVIEPSDDLPYDREEQAAPALPAVLDDMPDADRLTRVMLHPRRDYVFPDGVAVVRGHLHETPATPLVHVTDAWVWLDWYDTKIDDWHNAAESPFTRTTANGEFAAFLRLAPSAEPAVNPAGQIAVRLRVQRPNAAVRSGMPLNVPQGSPYPAFQTLAWSELQ